MTLEKLANQFVIAACDLHEKLFEIEGLVGPQHLGANAASSLQETLPLIAQIKRKIDFSAIFEVASREG